MAVKVSRFNWNLAKHSRANTKYAGNFQAQFYASFKRLLTNLFPSLCITRLQMAKSSETQKVGGMKLINFSPGHFHRDMFAMLKKKKVVGNPKHRTFSNHPLIISTIEWKSMLLWSKEKHKWVVLIHLTSLSGFYIIWPVLKVLLSLICRKDGGKTCQSVESSSFPFSCSCCF